MRPSLRSFDAAFVFVVLSAVVGCRGPWSAGDVKAPVAATPYENSAAISSATPTVDKDLPDEKSGEQTTEDQTQEEALAEVLEKLTENGALDPGEKRLLMANLREAKRENWPMIVRQFRSVLAYREQLAAREQKAASEKLDAEKTTQLASAKQTTPPAFASPTNSSPTDSGPTAVPVSFDVQQTLPSEKPKPVVMVLRNAPQAKAVSIEPAVVLPKPPPQLAHAISHVTTIDQTLDWQGHLDHAVHDLQASVQVAPGSTEEVNEHMRLRILQLLAGEQEAAMRPTPGATAAQQDYWNKQLFAVSTFLDSKQQPDNKRRAAGSLVHLDHARAKLAEMATMQVRNLAFVDSVAGYGAYEIHETTNFRPGDQVTLYAEIENYGSESTKEGYRTRLGTSYEVVDKNGNRVDSAQFPEVEDVCRNPRRDFHMQYTVVLPTQIYPEQYEIRLIVTDHHSHKIGQASVPFTIVE